MTRFLAERLFGPIGMTSAMPKFDGAGDFVGSSYVYATARDFARFGELYRHDGVTDSGDGERHPSRGMARPRPHEGRARPRATDSTTAGTGGCGRSSRAALSCHGYQGQFTIVVPDEELVVVHLGLTPVEVAPQLRLRLAELIEIVLIDWSPE